MGAFDGGGNATVNWQHERAKKCQEYIDRLLALEAGGDLLEFWKLYAEYLRWSGEVYSTERGMWVRAIERTIAALKGGDV